MSAQITPSPAPGEELSMALALVNTEIEPRGEKVDLVPDGPTLVDWLRARGLRSSRVGRITDEDLQQMRELRSAIRVAFLARAAGRRPPREVIGQINRAAGLVPATPRLRWDDAGPRRETRWVESARPTDRALAEIAAEAIATLLGDRGERLRLCEAHGCNRMFIADHRRRRWCSRACGDRVRVARHYRRANQSR